MSPARVGVGAALVKQVAAEVPLQPPLASGSCPATPPLTLPAARLTAAYRPFSGTLANGRYAAVNLAAGNVNGGVAGQLPLANGGCNGTSAATCFTNAAPTPTRAGDINYWNGSAWATLAGNNSGTKILTE